MLKSPRLPPAPRWPLADWPAWGWGWVAVVVGARLPVLGHAATAASESFVKEGSYVRASARRRNGSVASRACWWLVS